MTRYFRTKLMTRAMVGGTTDEIVFAILEEKPTTPKITQAWLDTGYIQTWHDAGERAKAQTAPVVFVALSGETKHYGDLFDVDTFERAAYASYVKRVADIRRGDRHFRGPLSAEQWLPIFRDAVEFADINSVASLVGDHNIHSSYERYQAERSARAAGAMKGPTAQEQLEQRRQRRPREEGIYQADNTEVFKLVRSSNGYLYAKQLIDGKFEFAPGAIKEFNLTEASKMSIEQARQYGQLTGTCCRCGARLTDEDSIKRGIGPVCATYF